jgi:hypothetical protein
MSNSVGHAKVAEHEYKRLIGSAGSVGSHSGEHRVHRTMGHYDKLVGTSIPEHHRKLEYAMEHKSPLTGEIKGHSRLTLNRDEVEHHSDPRGHIMTTAAKQNPHNGGTNIGHTVHDILKRHGLYESLEEGKAYVKPFNGGWKSSDKHGHVKFWNEHGKKSAHKHAGIEINEEELAELSHSKLDHYVSYASGEFSMAKNGERNAGTAEERKHWGRIAAKRKAGVAQAINKQDAATGREPEKPVKVKARLHETYHGGTAGYQQAKKGENIHHGVVMVHGTDGNRKVKKIHWAHTATFNGEVAVPSGASKNDQVRKAKKEGWRVDHHTASTSHDQVKSSLDNHHKRIKANDAMLRASAARRKKLSEMVAKEISQEDYNLIREMHAEAELPFYHNAIMAESDESKALVTFSHELHGIPTIKHDRSEGKFYIFEAVSDDLFAQLDKELLSEVSKKLLLRYAEKASKEAPEEAKKKGMSKLISRLNGIGQAYRRLKAMNEDDLADQFAMFVEGVNIEEMEDEHVNNLLAAALLSQDIQYVDRQRKMRRQVYEGTEILEGKIKPYVSYSSDGKTHTIIDHKGKERESFSNPHHAVFHLQANWHKYDGSLKEDHPSGNWFVMHEGTRVSGPHPSEEQAVIYRDLYITNNSTPLSEMSIEKTDVVNEDEQLDELSKEALRHYSKEAITQLRREKGNKKLAKKMQKRDKMVDMAAQKVVGDERIKVRAPLDESNLLETPTASYAAYAKKNKEEEDKIKDELAADGAVGATDPDAEEDNKRLKGVQEGTEDLEEGRRGRPPKSGAQVAGDEPNVIMSLRKAHYSTIGHKVQFKDGSHHVVSSDHASKILNHFNGLKPHEKEQFQAHISQGAEHLKNWSAFNPQDHKRAVPTEKSDRSLGLRTVKKANRVPDRTEMIRRIAQRLNKQKKAK